MAIQNKSKKIVKKTCDTCKKELSVVNFYNTNSALSSDGKLNICKTCVTNTIDYKNMETIYAILQLLDVPFIQQYWESAENNNPNNPWGSYITMANSKINEFKNKKYKDSKFFDSQKEFNKRFDIDFEVTREILARWGNHDEVSDYLKLEQFYNDMKDKNRIETPQEETYLKKLAIISLKMDQELEAGHYDEAKKLGDLFSKYMADSQFRAIDKGGIDKTGGLRGFGQIYAEVEKDDFIPPWEHYRKIKGLTQDIVDKSIMHIENFTLKLNKIKTMSEPPSDTPNLELDEIDGDV